MFTSFAKLRKIKNRTRIPNGSNRKTLNIDNMLQCAMKTFGHLTFRLIEAVTSNTYHIVTP